MRPFSPAREKAGPDQRGFSLIEAGISIVIMAMLGTVVYQFFTAITYAVQNSKAQLAAAELLQQQVEVIRNLPYASVGEISGIPSGVLASSKTATSGTMRFTILTTIRNIDDTADGTIGGSPNDLSPADYKQVEIEVRCTNCHNAVPLIMNTIQAPKALEGTSTNGALFVRVVDSGGVAIDNAAVSILNQVPTPDIVIDDLTDTTGWLRIIDAPPCTRCYQVTATKAGYSTARTYAVGDPSGNTNPSPAHATIVAQTVTQLTLAIDLTGTINVTTTTLTCAPVANVPFTLTGAKTVGTSPVRYKYDQALTTGATGTLTLSPMEWDTYTVANQSSGHDLRGIISPNPFALPPGGTQNVRMVLQPKNSKTILITVKDAATGQPVPDASVRLYKVNYGPVTQLTGSGYQAQTDWDGGSGQATLVDDTKYFAQDGDVNHAANGQVTLRSSLGVYATPGDLTSSTFDSGGIDTLYGRISWLPVTQPTQTGANSVKMQIAANNDNTTWNFVGPDGTAATYFTGGDADLGTYPDNKRYFRYKLFLATANGAYTPTVSDVIFTYTAACVPPGQALFTGMTAANNYEVTVTKAGYQTWFNNKTMVSNDWNEAVVTLTPN